MFDGLENFIVYVAVVDGLENFILVYVAVVALIFVSQISWQF